MNLALIPLLPGVGPTELIIILTIILLLFGAKKIPELAKGLGTGVREFKKGTSGADDREELRSGEGKNEAVAGGEEEGARSQDAREDGADSAAERAARRTEQQQR